MSATPGGKGKKQPARDGRPQTVKAEGTGSAQARSTRKTVPASILSSENDTPTSQSTPNSPIIPKEGNIDGVEKTLSGHSPDKSNSRRKATVPKASITSPELSQVPTEAEPDRSLDNLKSYFLRTLTALPVNGAHPTDKSKKSDPVLKAVFDCEASSSLGDDFLGCAKSLRTAAWDKLHGTIKKEKSYDGIWETLRIIIFAKSFLSEQRDLLKISDAKKGPEFLLRESLSKGLTKVFNIDGYERAVSYFKVFKEEISSHWEFPEFLGFENATKSKKQMFLVLAWKRADDAIRFWEEWPLAEDEWEDPLEEWEEELAAMAGVGAGEVAEMEKAMKAAIMALEDAINALSCALWEDIGKPTLEESGLEQYHLWMDQPIRKSIEKGKDKGEDKGELSSSRVLMSLGYKKMKECIEPGHYAWQYLAMVLKEKYPEISLRQLAEKIHQMLDDGLDEETIRDMAKFYYEEHKYLNAEKTFRSEKFRMEEAPAARTVQDFLVLRGPAVRPAK